MKKAGNKNRWGFVKLKRSPWPQATDLFEPPLATPLCLFPSLSLSQPPSFLPVDKKKQLLIQILVDSSLYYLYLFFLSVFLTKYCEHCSYDMQLHPAPFFIF